MDLHRLSLALGQDLAIQLDADADTVDPERPLQPAAARRGGQRRSRCAVDAASARPRARRSAAGTGHGRPGRAGSGRRPAYQGQLLAVRYAAGRHDRGAGAARDAEPEHQPVEPLRRCDRWRYGAPGEPGAADPSRSLAAVHRVGFLCAAARAGKGAGHGGDDLGRDRSARPLPRRRPTQSIRCRYPTPC